MIKNDEFSSLTPFGFPGQVQDLLTQVHVALNIPILLPINGQRFKHIETRPIDSHSTSIDWFLHDGNIGR